VRSSPGAERVATPLKKELGFLSVFCIASGAMISSGLFVLPGVLFAMVGPGLFLCYLLAAALVVPALFSKAELSTAMPKAGGSYFFIDRSLGPAFGTLGGIASWASLSFKSAFALIGMSAFSTLILPKPMPDLHMRLVACGLVLVFMIINLWGAKHAGVLQIALVLALILILGGYVVAGFGARNPSHYRPMLPHGMGPVFVGAASVFVAFGGVTKVASVAEEVKDPGRVLPLGMLASFAIVTVLYVLVAYVTVGLVPADKLATSLTPISTGGETLWSTAGMVVMTVAALIAFISTGNAGIMAASRFPLAMSRDGLLPEFLGKLGRRRGTPHYAIMFTSLFMIAVILFLDIRLFVKTASAMMILLFMFMIVSVILMRESRIASYRPKFRSPLYPWLHIVGIGAYGFLLVELGSAPLLISTAILGVGFIWYAVYARVHVLRESALIHLARRIASRSLPGHDLEAELAEIVHTRDAHLEDRFDLLVRRCTILDLAESVSGEQVFRMIADQMGRHLGMPPEKLYQLLKAREMASSTILRPGLAVPHIVVEGSHCFDLLLVRCRDGIALVPDKPPIHAMFVLIGSADERNFHLRALMAIAEIVQDVDFDAKWRRARGEEGLRKMILRAERRREA